MATHTLNQTTQRRELLGAGGAALLLLVAPAERFAKAEELDAALLAACASLSEKIAAVNALPEGNPLDATDPTVAAYYATYDAIRAIKPTTMAGVLAKCRAAVAEEDGCEPSCSSGALLAWEAMHDLMRLSAASEL